MEFIMVSCEEERSVHVDGQLAGLARQTLMVQEGHHVIDLGVPRNYSPPSWSGVVTGTTSISPLIIMFTVIDPSNGGRS